jgi:hypothetical protein
MTQRDEGHDYRDSKNKAKRVRAQAEGRQANGKLLVR